MSITKDQADQIMQLAIRATTTSFAAGQDWNPETRKTDSDAFDALAKFVHALEGP
jgi:hypothetical protein